MFGRDDCVPNAFFEHYTTGIHYLKSAQSEHYRILVVISAPPIISAPPCLGLV